MIIFRKKIMNKRIISFLLVFIFVAACNGKIPGADARKIPAKGSERVKKNIEEGRGFTLMGSAKKKNSGEFDFASSNELWRASLDTIDFMPLALANYSGGIIVTDWYSDGSSNNESVKISIRFLSNEVRSDALTIKVFYKNCSMERACKVSDRSSELSIDLTKKILAKAAIYKEISQNKKKTKYIAEPYKD